MTQNSAPRRIAIVTGTRADFGLLRSLIDETAAHPALEPQIIATGMHLAPQFGSTIREVEAVTDVAMTVDMLLSSDTGVGAAKSVGLGVIGFADAFAALRPDVVVVLGDRFEILAAAQAAMLLRIPVAHVHGGEVTTGALDDSMRHAVTKMASLHFVAAEPYRRRVLQMGEREEHVFTVGAPGLDQLDRTRLLDRDALQESLGVPLATPLLAVTYHPVTTAADPTGGAEDLLAALDAARAGTIILTMPNADPGGRRVMSLMQEWVGAAGNVHSFTSLGSLRYLSLLAHADVVVGNSSSGIIEAPAVGTPTVNIGSRQDGRLRAPSIIDVAPDPEAIAAAISKAVAMDLASVDPRTLPYGGGGAGRAMAEHLAVVPLEDLLPKPFVDIEADR